LIATGVGALRFCVELMPSWPAELLPQHDTAPLVIAIAQVCSRPVSIVRQLDVVDT
jgi:hypothetical protein